LVKKSRGNCAVKQVIQREVPPIVMRDIVIVGAGAAGIAAARTLREQGIDALVLEARDRIGGRAWTDTTTLGVPIDLGCAWLHSADRNPWTAYAREARFQLLERSPVWQRRIGREEASPAYLQAWHAAFERNELLIAEAAAAGRDVPVAQVVPDDQFRKMFDAVMGWLMGVNAAEVSTVDYARYQDSEVNWAVPQGLGSLVAHCGAALDVRLTTPVRTIDCRGERVRIETDSGVIESRAVIVTLPTSLLARGDVRFLPELPVMHQEAFAAVPLGVPNKVFFEVAPDAMPFAGTVHFVGTDKDERTASYATRPADQNVLLAFFGGTLSRELEQRGELEAFARDELARIFGSNFNSQLQRAISTAWASDPWSRGSYSAALPGQADMRERMSVPVQDRIFFAGEACSPDYFGTIIGASASGIAAAKRAADAIADR
jgi:monoamine oxidase